MMDFSDFLKRPEFFNLVYNPVYYSNDSISVFRPPYGEKSIKLLHKYKLLKIE